MSLNLVPLNIETLKEVRGGLVAVMLEKALQRMAMDIDAAPDIAEFRNVTLIIRAKPVMEHMELSHVVTEFEVKGKVPARVTSAISCVRSNTNGVKQLMFNLDAQQNPAQQTFFDNEDEEADSDKPVNDDVR